MLVRESVNCIAVEWKKGVKTQYVQAVNNARVVAAQVAAMIQFIMVITAVHLRLGASGSEPAREETQEKIHRNATLS